MHRSNVNTATGRLALLALALVLTACGSSKDGSAAPQTAVTSKAPSAEADPVLQRAKERFLDAEYASIQGDTNTPEYTVDIDISFGRDWTHGNLAIDGNRAEIRRIGGSTYVRADAQYWRTTTGDRAADYADLWLDFGADNASAAAYTREGFTADIWDDGPLTQDRKEDRGGIPCAVFTTTDPDNQAEYFFALDDGRPIAVVSPATKGTLSFDYRAKPAPVKPPAAQIVTTHRNG